ncbi:SIR2 family protein [Rhizobium cremeum]|uniref:SIR2 family NAD-dependent protein deacylase n=1 Tax=Rhizobium TaxID=379 RepID=UPI000DD867D3|nr:SIR2 family protein [Rhizobium cremeum]MCJ7997489.1 SIR2 family protein [Rhizobium cremeum]MCJ8002673.1 SIR2 family protein [Rhizobium cremeum]
MVIQDDNMDDLVDNWPSFQKRVTVFLGAGASIGALNQAGRALPNAYQLRNDLWEKYKWRADDGNFDPSTLRLMSLEHAAAIIEAKTGRTVLGEYLQDAFHCSKPLWQHLALPYLNPASLFTTNYDQLIELGYAGSGKVLDVICSNRSPMAGQTALFKPHGSLSHINQPVGQGGLVITQFDYLEMIADYRKMLQNAMTGFSSTCVLIIGYSFGDMDIGSELYALRKKNDGIPWYAIFPRADKEVRRMYSRRFGIEQINRTFESFLADLDARIDFLPSKLKHAQKNVLEASDLIQ